jgi:hypothetical protein
MNIGAEVLMMISRDVRSRPRSVNVSGVRSQLRDVQVIESRHVGLGELSFIFFHEISKGRLDSAIVCFLKCRNLSVL